MKLTITKKKIGKWEKSFETLETTIFNTPVRIAKALSEELKNFEKVVNGASAEFTISEEVASRLYLTATVKNGYTNLYLTLKKDKAPATEDGALPF